ncbi:MAG TPA: hypothetical protein VEM13_06385 [Gemmatimonadales bacterium]|nr:hypothetical protein [Gemmatimonadales bacterium]
MGTPLALVPGDMKTLGLLALLGVAAAMSPLAAQTISSAANQTFIVGDPSTAISPITIRATGGGQIKANNDIRVRIPAGLNMRWDPTITTATITGSAAIKVSTTVSYANGNLDLVINVITNFGNGDQITVSGLNFTNFTAPSAASRLGLITGGASGAVVANDNNTKTIVAKVYGVSVAPHATTASQLPSNGVNYTVAFTVTNTGNGSTSYDLLTTKRPGTVLTTVSIAGAGITQGANPDSARLTNLLGGTSAVATVTYSVAMAASGTKDTLVFKARAVLSPATADTGKLTVTVIRPTMTIAKSVSPGGTQLPGANLTYTVTLSNIGSSNAASVVIVDTLPAAVRFQVGSVVNTLPAGVSVLVDYSNNGGATWTYVPASGACGAPAGYDACVNRVRWRLQNPLSSTAPNNTGTLQLVTQIR